MAARSLSELRLRAGVLLRASVALREECVTIAREKSPSASIALAQLAARKHGLLGRDELAVGKATRWLAVIRRDHGDAVFEDTVRTLSTTTP